MQSLIAVAAVFALYAIVWCKNYGYSFVASLRLFVKRLALCVMSFSWGVVLVAVFLLSHYSNITGLLENSLSAHSLEGIKSLTRLIFGVDSAFAALQMLAVYSLMAGFVSCLVLSFGVIIRVAYRTVLKVSRTDFVEDRQYFANYSQHSMPTFKLYLKYNS